MNQKTANFDGNVIRASTVDDLDETLILPPDADSTGWAGSFEVQACHGGGPALLTVTSEPSASGSRIFFAGRTVTLFIRARDLAQLAPQSGEAWAGRFIWMVTDAQGHTSEFARGTLVVGGCA